MLIAYLLIGLLVFVGLFKWLVNKGDGVGTVVMLALLSLACASIWPLMVLALSLFIGYLIYIVLKDTRIEIEVDDRDERK